MMAMPSSDTMSQSKTHTLMDCRSRFSLLCCLPLQRQPILHYPTRASTINLFITFLYPIPFYLMRTQNDAIIDKCCYRVFPSKRCVGDWGGSWAEEWHSTTTTIRQCVCLVYRMQTTTYKLWWYICCWWYRSVSFMIDFVPLYCVYYNRRHVGVWVCECVSGCVCMRIWCVSCACVRTKITFPIYLFIWFYYRRTTKSLLGCFAGCSKFSSVVSNTYIHTHMFL